MKKVFAVMLSSVMSLSLMTCIQVSAAQIPNPFTEYATLEEATKNTGFDVTAPAYIDDMKQSMICVNESDKLVEVIYTTTDDKEVSIRKAECNGDISGDFTKYDETSTVEIGNNNVTMKGNGKKVSVATWTNNDYSYSITNNFGMNKRAVSDLVKMVTMDNDGMVIDENTEIGGDVLYKTVSVGIPNPFTEYTTLEEATKNVGFSFTVPDSIEEYSQCVIRTLEGEDNDSMIEVLYHNDSENLENKICLRKAVGNGDISGDYTIYEESDTLSVGDIEISVKGENNKIKLATWKDGNYTYSAGFYFDTGISREAFANFIISVQ